LDNYGYKKNNPNNPDYSRFSPKEIIDAIMQSDFGKIFKTIENKLTTPFENIPQNGESVDIRRVSDTLAGTNDELFLSFRPPRGFEAIITGYGIFSDAQFAAQAEFIPRLNGSRIFPYHGTPTNMANPLILPYRISLGLGPDLTDVALIECSLRVKETDIFTWNLTNSSIVTQTMGVRFKGYLRTVNEMRDYKIGG
jgi:hypothetical protein